MDRNDTVPQTFHGLPASLSARRAWIEILISRSMSRQTPVALRKESVDRNIGDGCVLLDGIRRSPQGERG